MEDETLITLTADIVAAHVVNNSVAVGDMGNLVQRVHAALSQLGQAPEPAPAQKEPRVSVRASVKPDYIVCMECGKKQKTLRRHLHTAHRMTPQQYRADYGLPDSYPMTAPNYSERRREMAKSISLGRKRAGTTTEGNVPPAPPPATRGRGRKASAK
ncbi:MAG: MucR family transcriptional regulator [Alphaproteobacteria bacterium]|nr:MucR family transcriptional regulator [Alphaproteobacteria bacterium]